MPDKTSLPRFDNSFHEIRQKAQSNTLADQRRRQLIDLLYRNGGGMLMSEILKHPDAPPMVEAVIDQNPDYFHLGQRLVRLSWISANTVHCARRAQTLLERGEVA
jgi:hypothetical protein